ncbi:hypothetical protein [Burkholderia sp. 22PA0106]|uniref:hypothetical protein n=1 Tax=Burkholderia sp. 22PA0106 TaxID=3237371 RepID=UPI0039C0BF39
MSSVMMRVETKSMGFPPEVDVSAHATRRLLTPCCQQHGNRATHASFAPVEFRTSRTAMTRGAGRPIMRCDFATQPPAMPKPIALLLLRLRPLFALCLASTLLASTAGCHAQAEPDAAGQMSMKPSVTYLFLLRRTPFFTALSTEQLQWVIAHSKEWQVREGSVVDACRAGGSENASDDWILLDGGWAVEHDGRAERAGRGEAGQWFNRTVANGARCRLVATESGYVMKIAHADLQNMLARGFDFDAPLAAGRAYYRTMFGNGRVNEAR